MCLYPKLILNRKYMANKKNGGNPPPLKDKRTMYVPVGCGKCIECKKQKARNWSVRLQEEIKHDKTAKFVTLTFSEESLKELAEGIEGLSGYELENEIATKGTRRFLERWRKHNKKSVKHWLVTELGQTRTERIHIHGLIWCKDAEEIDKRWQYGNTWIGDYVNERTINYIVKYVNKVDIVHKEYNSKILTSAGIGKGYLKSRNRELNKYKKGGTKETYTTRQGTKISLPIYYRNHIYTEEEREQLWLEKLDKQERWVRGEKVSVKNGEEDYNKLVEWHRRINKQLGYGDNTINWERRRYENARRNINKLTKLKKQQQNKP